MPLSDGGDEVCPACSARVPGLGLHALSRMAGGSVTHRHHAIRDLLWHQCRTAGLYPELETPGLLPDTLYRPAD
eukprot:gene9368-4496_t